MMFPQSFVIGSFQRNYPASRRNVNLKKRREVYPCSKCNLLVYLADYVAAHPTRTTYIPRYLYQTITHCIVAIYQNG